MNGNKNIIILSEKIGLYHVLTKCFAPKYRICRYGHDEWGRKSRELLVLQKDTILFVIETENETLDTLHQIKEIRLEASTISLKKSECLLTTLTKASRSTNGWLLDERATTGGTSPLKNYWPMPVSSRRCFLSWRKLSKTARPRTSLSKRTMRFLTFLLVKMFLEMRL